MNQTGNDRTALYSSLGRAGSRSVGMLRWFALWQSLMSVELLVRQAQQQRWPRLVRRRNTQSSTAVTFLSRLQLRPLVFSTPQPIACWRRLAWRFLWTPGNQERPVSYTSAFQALMPSCCTIPCRPLTARTDYRTHDCLAIHNFLTTLGNFFRGLKNNNNNSRGMTCDCTSVLRVLSETTRKTRKQ